MITFPLDSYQKRSNKLQKSWKFDLYAYCILKLLSWLSRVLWLVYTCHVKVTLWLSLVTWNSCVLSREAINFLDKSTFTGFLRDINKRELFQIYFNKKYWITIILYFILKINVFEIDNNDVSSVSYRFFYCV